VTPIIGTCYLIHFDQLINPLFPCMHYLGWTVDVNARFTLHATGLGARLCQVAIERGISFRIVRLWEGVEKSFERELKNRRNAPKLCPVCCHRGESHPYPQWVKQSNAYLQGYTGWAASGALQVARYSKGYAAHQLDEITLANANELPF